MAGIALDLLWALFWIIVCAGVLWLFIYGIKTYVYPIPARLEGGVWFLFLILCLISAITIFAGGGGGMHFPTFR